MPGVRCQGSEAQGLKLEMVEDAASLSNPRLSTPSLVLRWLGRTIRGERARNVRRAGNSEKQPAPDTQHLVPNASRPSSPALVLSDQGVRKVETAFIELDSCRQQTQVMGQQVSNCEQQSKLNSGIIDQQAGTIVKLNAALADKDQILARSEEAHRAELKAARGTWRSRFFRAARILCRRIHRGGACPMNPLDIQRVALWWGPGILVLIIFGYGFLRLAHYWIEKSMEVKRQQMDGAYGLVRQYIEQFLGAQSGQADALSRLANSVEHRESQESFEHQEILIALKALHRDMNSLRCRSGEDFCALRASSGFSGRCSSSSDLRRESRAPGFSSLCRPPAAAPDAAGVESEREHFPDQSAEISARLRHPQNAQA